MKIMTNTVGNYTPHINNNSVIQAKFTEKSNETESKIVANPNGNDLTKEEKIFFINRYPENKSEITDYHFYQKNGEMTGVKIGSQFDRRG